MGAARAPRDQQADVGTGHRHRRRSVRGWAGFHFEPRDEGTAHRSGGASLLLLPAAGWGSLEGCLAMRRPARRQKPLRREVSRKSSDYQASSTCAGCITSARVHHRRSSAIRSRSVHPDGLFRTSLRAFPAKGGTAVERLRHSSCTMACELSADIAITYRQ